MLGAGYLDFALAIVEICSIEISVEKPSIR